MSLVTLQHTVTGEAAAPAEKPLTDLSLRHRLEFILARTILLGLGAIPHRLARALCFLIAALCYWIWPRLRRVGLFNLSLAYPEWTSRQRRRVLFRSFRNLGRMLADFAHFPHLSSQNIRDLIVYDGLEHFERANSQEKGLIFLTAHFGGWELGSFAHGVYGHPVAFVVRHLDNPAIDRLINHYRCLSGGRPIEKSDFARQALRALKQHESVGILMDQNMLPSEGIFVDFFGLPACTTTGPARIARKTGAPLVLGLVIWDAAMKKYRLRFEPVEWQRRDGADEEIAANTAHFMQLLERYVRQYPDQWLWVHKRWKTRPPGEPPLYPF